MTSTPNIRKKQRWGHHYPIDTWDALATAMRGGRTLVKTNSSRGLFYEVRGKRCDPAIAKQAIARGWVCPLDSGLFGPAFAQSWHFRGAF